MTIPYGFYLIFINIDEDVIWSNVRWLQSSEEAGPCILAELSTGRVDQIISIVHELDKKCSTTLSLLGVGVKVCPGRCKRVEASVLSFNISLNMMRM